MSDCCASHSPSGRSCPACGARALAVSQRTLLHQLRAVWRLDFSLDEFHFCASPECEVIYFNATGIRLGASALREPVGVKQADEKARLCYCFGISRGEADADTRAFVLEQTKAGLCSCATHNPSGRCCLKDFPHTAAS